MAGPYIYGMINKIENTNQQDTGGCREKSKTGKINVPHTGENIEEWEEKMFLRVISPLLSKEQENRIITPAYISGLQQDVLAVHWHPEHIPMELIGQRIKNSFPDARNSLIIPTQHNSLMEFNGFAGVEIDCFSPEFDRKVQLLIHFTAEKAAGAEKIRVMAEHTFKYRSRQLFDILHALAGDKMDDSIKKAETATAAEREIEEFVGAYSCKILRLIESHAASINNIFLKNKLIRDYFEELKGVYDGHIIDMAQVFIKSVKELVKASFSTGYFYKTRDVISQARESGAGIVVPHPEQFWPILLADYDVDGYEVWNPQSRQFTEFLIGAVAKMNGNKKSSKRPLLIFMGDDTHMGEKIRNASVIDRDKASREIGMQPAWDDPDIMAALKTVKASRERVIDEYRQRLL
jgi:hypothetical protein